MLRRPPQLGCRMLSGPAGCRTFAGELELRSLLQLQVGLPALLSCIVPLVGYALSACQAVLFNRDVRMVLLHADDLCLRVNDLRFEPCQ